MSTRRSRRINATDTSIEGNDTKRRKVIANGTVRSVASSVKDAAIKMALSDSTNLDNSSPKLKRRRIEKVEPKDEPETHITQDGSEGEDDEYDIEKRREENVRDNAEFLARLGMSVAKSHFLEAVATKKKTSSRGYKEKREREVLPLRPRSLRIRNMAPDGSSLPATTPEPPLYAQDEHPRPEGTLSMRDVIQNKPEDDVHDKFLAQLEGLTITEEHTMSPDLTAFVNRCKKMKITEERVAKVVPNRIFSMAVHPTEDKILAIAGGKWGKLGFWDVTSQAFQDGVFTYSPHSRPIRGVSVWPGSPQRVYTASYDGSVRCMDLAKACFTEVYVTEDDSDVLMNEVTNLDANVLYVSKNDAKLARLDLREEMGKVAEYDLGHKSIRSTSIHPLHPQYMATAHFDGTVHIWDARKLSGQSRGKPLWSGQHAKGVEAAYFSPLTGTRLLTTSMDDSLGIFSTPHLLAAKPTVPQHFISHNNHTGRWLTKFRATWHPRRDDAFLCGAMLQPRRVQLFAAAAATPSSINTTTSTSKKGSGGGGGSGGKEFSIVHEFSGEQLASVCSLNAFHPTLDVLAGGNSSGRVHVFM